MMSISVRVRLALSCLVFLVANAQAQSVDLTAVTLYGTDADGNVRAEERWNTIYLDGAWDVGFYEGQADVGPPVTWLNREGDLGVDVVLSVGETRTFSAVVNEPDFWSSSDGDNSAALDISDALNVLGFLFLGSFPLNETLPGPVNCGPDPTIVIDPDGPGVLPGQPATSLGCDMYPSAAGLACE
jgi:hypothetical protein